MNGKDIAYYFFITLAALSAMGMLLVKNVLHAALLLIICLLSVAGIYILLHAEFLAVSQLMVYAGGVLVLIIFGIMLSSRISNQPMNVETARKIPGIMTAAGIFFLLVYLFNTLKFTKTEPEADSINTVKGIGLQLMSTHVAPFEIAGILLLVSLIGAAVTASFLIKK